MLRVGLTGGLASGKTLVGETLRTLGCYLIQADQLGHEVLKPDGAAYEAVVREFGRGIVNPDGTINRRQLAAEVFQNPDRLRILNELVHPPVRLKTIELIEQYAAIEPKGIVIVEAAILVETGSYKHYDRLIVAACRPEQQIERAMHRDGITRAEAAARLERQLPLEEKIKVADYVIDTSGTKEHTVEQTRAVLESLRSIQQ